MKSLTIAIFAVLALSACTTPQKERLWTAIERATRDKDALPPEPTPPPVVTPAPAPKPPAEKHYTRVIRVWRDGSLWKPISESNRRAVMLTPSNTRGEFVRAELRRIAGDILIEAPRFDGDTHNGNRPHWRMAKTGLDYGNDFVFRGIRADGTFRDWIITEGGARIE
jgi:hypothetical protein